MKIGNAALRAKLDEPFSLLQPLHDVRPERPEPAQQILSRAVALSHPNEGCRLVAQEPAIDEIFILRDDDCLIIDRVFPEHRIVCGVQSQVEGVNGLMLAEIAYPPGQGRRKLRVDEEVNTAWSTA